MPILSRDIDPTIALALQERMSQLLNQAVLEPQSARLRGEQANRWREILRRNSYHFWAAGTCFLGGIASVPTLAHLGPELTITAMLALHASAVGLIVRGLRQSKQHLTEFADPEVLRNAGDLIALGPAEKLYCEAVAALVDAERALTETACGEILTQLNELLARYRKMDGPVRHSLAARGNQPLEKLEGELSELIRRRDAASDAGAKATLEQSIALCAQRLTDARAVAPAREQAEAQQELILQAMSAVHASLTRMALADSVTVSADVGELQRTVSQVNLQTRAVEDALNEVLTLRG